MFPNPCSIPDAELLTFVLISLVIGAILGFLFAWTFRGRDSVQHVKGGCLLAPAIAVLGLMASAKLIRIFNPEECPFTPDAQFVPWLAAIALPIGLLLGIAIWHRLAIRGDK